MLLYKDKTLHDRMRNAMCYWMAYLNKIDREKLLEEGSLRYSLADSITSREISAQRIELERVHPLFKNKKMDFYIYDENVSKIENAYELKLAKDDTNKETENRRVFYDLLRLYFLQKYTDIKCYFIMCGPKSKYIVEFVGDLTKENLQEVKDEGSDDNSKVKMKQTINKEEGTEGEEIRSINSSGFYSELFEFKIDGVKDIQINVTDGNFKDLYKDFFNGKNCYEFKDEKLIQDNFKFKDGTSLEDLKFKDSFTFKTKCISHSNMFGELQDIDFLAGIWEISD
ncbi:MAG: hypothetical protein WED10_06430 [Brumimicrobium sp.]